MAVLALELTWPVPAEGDSPRYEPWTATRRWEQIFAEKLQGFDGVLLQRSPSLLLVAFGMPHTLEQLPQRPVRLLGHTAPGEILVSSEVAPLVEGWYELLACEGPFRGEPSDAIRPYSVVGLRPHYSPLEMYAQRPLNRFVGREQELSTLSDLLILVQEGRGQLVGIMGEPGIGKSRLYYEFTCIHLPQRWLLLEASATSYDRGTPYLPIIDLLKAYFQLDARDDLQTIRDKVTDRLLALGRPCSRSCRRSWCSWRYRSRTPSGNPSIRPNVVSASWKP